jgi:hypothetical protein
MASIISAGTSSGTALNMTADTSGQLQLATGASATTAVTIDTSQNVAFAKGFTVGATAAPAFSVYQTTGTSLSAGTTTKVLFDTKSFDTNSNFASSRFTPTVAGYYQMNACVFVSGTVSAFLTILTGSSVSKSGSITNIAGQGQSASVVSSVVYFNGSTDYVEIYVYSSNALTTLNGQYTYFNGCFLRSA